MNLIKSNHSFIHLQTVLKIPQFVTQETDLGYMRILAKVERNVHSRMYICLLSCMYMFAVYLSIT